MVDQAATAWHDLGVSRKGDRVAFMLANRPDFLQAWFGLAKVGDILTAINTRWQPPEIRHFLDLTQPSFVLSDETFRDMLIGAMKATTEPTRLWLDDAEGEDRNFAVAMNQSCEPSPSQLEFG